MGDQSWNFGIFPIRRQVAVIMAEPWDQYGVTKKKSEKLRASIAEIAKACQKDHGKRHVVECAACYDKVMGKVKQRYAVGKDKERDWFGGRRAFIQELGGLVTQIRDRQVPPQAVAERVRAEKRAWYAENARRLLLRFLGEHVLDRELLARLDDQSVPLGEVAGEVRQVLERLEVGISSAEAIGYIEQLIKLTRIEDVDARIQVYQVALFNKVTQDDKVALAQRKSYLDKIETLKAVDKVAERIQFDHDATERSQRLHLDEHAERLRMLQTARNVYRAKKEKELRRCEEAKKNREAASNARNEDEVGDKLEEGEVDEAGNDRANCKLDDGDMDIDKPEEGEVVEDQMEVARRRKSDQSKTADKPRQGMVQDSSTRQRREKTGDVIEVKTKGIGATDQAGTASSSTQVPGELYDLPACFTCEKNVDYKDFVQCVYCRLFNGWKIKRPTVYCNMECHDQGFVSPRPHSSAIVIANLKDHTDMKQHSHLTRSPIGAHLACVVSGRIQARAGMEMPPWRPRTALSSVESACGSSSCPSCFARRGA